MSGGMHVSLGDQSEWGVGLSVCRLGIRRVSVERGRSGREARSSVFRDAVFVGISRGLGTVLYL